MELSVVVPARDEAESIAALVPEIQAALDGLVDYEVIYVDDGSRDASLQTLAAIAATFPRLRVVRHRRSYGQSAAVLTGVRIARSPWIVTLDGDGQNDPADIPRLLAIVGDLARDHDVRLISGVRRGRSDSPTKQVASRIANAVRRRVLNDGARDSACGLKLFLRECFLALPQFDHLHRFLPALVLRGGGEVVYVAVNHRPRRHGTSHYGLWDRLWEGIVDLIGVMWLCRRSRQPEVIETTQTIENGACSSTPSG